MKKGMFGFAVVLLALVLLAGNVLAQGTTKRVGLVVAFPDGSRQTKVVTVPAAATTFDALKASGLNIASQDSQFGPAVCSINNTGCPSSNCFCDAKHFWAFYHLDAAAKKWVSSAEGVGAYKPADGAVEGLIWSELDANFSPTQQPPVMTFDQVAGSAAPAQAATAKAPTSLPQTGGDSGSLVWLATLGAALLITGVAVSRGARIER